MFWIQNGQLSLLNKDILIIIQKGMNMISSWDEFSFSQRKKKKKKTLTCKCFYLMAWSIEPLTLKLIVYTTKSIKLILVINKLRMVKHSNF